MTRRKLFRPGAIAGVALVAAACVPSTDVARLDPVARSCAPATPGVHTVWYGPQGSGDSRNLARWCSTVGAPIFQPAPASPSFDGAPAPTVASATDKVIVATWNPNAGAGDLRRFLEEELGYSCESRRSDQHFVLLLQEALRRSEDIPAAAANGVVPPAVAEATRQSERRGAVDVASRCGLSVFYAAAARNGAEEREGLREEKGNAILSSLPISDPVVVELPFEGARRVSVIATVRAPAGQALRVASVHFLSAARPWRILTTGNASRLREATGLLEALRQIEAETGSLPTLAAGDLNTWSRRETALLHLRDYFVDSPTPLAEPTRGGFPTDHILFRGLADGDVRSVPGSYRRVDETYNSDHHPVMLSVEMSPRR